MRPTLNVNGTGAKEIQCQRGELNTPCTKSSDISKKEGYGVYSWDTYTVLDLYYDDRYDYWVVLGDPIVKRFYSNWDANAMYNVSITGISWLGFLYNAQK